MKQTPNGIKTRNQRTNPAIVLNGTSNKIIKIKNRYVKKIQGKKIQNNKKIKPPKSTLKKESKISSIHKISKKNGTNTSKLLIKSKVALSNKSSIKKNKIPTQTVQIKKQLLKDLQQLPILLVPKKGRPRKIINIITQNNTDLSSNERKQLEDFIEHALKLRKVKNEKDFYQSFSRIVLFAQESYEYGDLSKILRFPPSKQQIEQIGQKIARGIRKQALLQAQTAVSQLL